MTFIKEQLEKEKNAAKKVFGWYVNYLIFFWGLIGLVMLFSPAWILGIIFILGAWYVYSRRQPKKLD